MLTLQLKQLCWLRSHLHAEAEHSSVLMRPKLSGQEGLLGARAA